VRNNTDQFRKFIQFHFAPGQHHIKMNYNHTFHSILARSHTPFTEFTSAAQLILIFLLSELHPFLRRSHATIFHDELNTAQSTFGLKRIFGE